jgi:FkbM family methyltransferase
MFGSPPVVFARKLARATGLTGWISRMHGKKLDRQKETLLEDYRRRHPTEADVRIGDAAIKLRVIDEQEFCRAMSYVNDEHLLKDLLAHLRPGDCLWDVGANFGLYGLLCARKNGTQAILFDPDPWCGTRIRENIEINGMSNVQLMEVALAQSEGTMRFQPASQSVVGTSHLLSADASAKEAQTAIEVPVASGDQFRKQRQLPCPNLIKIDVEGFEGQVLRGLRETLADPACRFVLVEVHFTLLERNGLGDTPGIIQQLIKSAGFDEIRWMDASHLRAVKNTPS